MRVKIKYPTKERKYISQNTYQNVSKWTELEPFRILRRPCGVGAAANRYRYEADFIAPDDAEFSRDGMIRQNIDRKTNPHFKPKILHFEGDICVKCND